MRLAETKKAIGYSGVGILLGAIILRILQANFAPHMLVERGPAQLEAELFVERTVVFLPDAPETQSQVVTLVVKDTDRNPIAGMYATVRVEAPDGSVSAWLLGPTNTMGYASRIFTYQASTPGRMLLDARLFPYEMGIRAGTSILFWY
jgi:hypothetical protein